MSHSTNSNVSTVNFCDVCSLFFETKRGLYSHQSYDSKQKELLEKMFDSDDDGAITEPPAKTREILYDSNEDFIYPKPFTKTKIETKIKDNTRDIIKTKHITKTKTKTENSIYSGIKFECNACCAEFRNKINSLNYSLI